MSYFDDKEYREMYNEQMREKELLARDKIEDFIKEFDLDNKKFALLCDVSTALVRYVLEGSYTHPKIANKIGVICNLTEEEIEMLISPIRRKNDPRYEYDEIPMPKYGRYIKYATRK